MTKSRLAPLVLSLAAAPCRAATGPWTYGAEADFNRQYVEQGIAYDRGFLVQPSIWAARNGFTLNYWANNVIRNDNYSAPDYSGKIFPEYPAPHYTGMKEHDLSLSYDVAWRGLSFNPTFRAYTGDRVDLAFRQPFFGQVVVKLAYPVGFLKVYTTQTFELNQLAGDYFGELGVSWDSPIGKGTLTTSAELGVGGAEYNENYFGESKTALNLFQTTVALNYPWGDHIYFRPHAEFSSILPNSLREKLSPPSKANTINLGLAMGVKY